MVLLAQIIIRNMARKKEESFILTVAPDDLGVMQYGYGQGGKKTNDGQMGERKKLWRSPAAIYLFLVSAFLVFWFLYSVITATLRDGAQAILSYGVDFFVLAVCLFIVFLSICKLWGKFARFALNRGLVKNEDRASVESSTEMMEETYEQLEKDPPVFEVYENYVRATDGETVKAFDRARIGRVILYKLSNRCLVNIASDGEFSSEVVVLKGLRLPLREVKKLQAVLGDKLSVEPLYIPTEGKGHSRLRESLGGVNLAGIIMGLIAVAAGGGVLALHYTLADNIPIALGAFFMAVGVLIFFIGLQSLPIVKAFIIPLLAGGIFTVIPFLFCKIIAGEDGVSFAFSSADNFFSSFNALYCGAAFLTAIGLLGVAWAFICLVKYIKYGEY